MHTDHERIKTVFSKNHLWALGAVSNLYPQTSCKILKVPRAVSVLSSFITVDVDTLVKKKKLNYKSLSLKEQGTKWVSFSLVSLSYYSF